MYTVSGSMFTAVLFLGINNCTTVIPYITTERTVVYRERFAGMYSSWAYSFAQVCFSYSWSHLDHSCRHKKLSSSKRIEEMFSTHEYLPEALFP